MRILSLHLQNFQGIKEAEYEFHGENASVYGDNETGKTTLYNAITWLLFDRPSTGAKSFLPKTKDKAGADIHKLEHSVEMVVMDLDGVCHTLRKVLKEKYTKRRGARQEEFDGHITDYYINEEPLRERDYTSKLQKLLCTEEQARILMMPNYFAETLPWEQRRQILLDICGDVSDEEILSSDSELTELRQLLRISDRDDRLYTVEQYRKIVAGKAREISQELDSMPARIDEAKRAVPNGLRDIKDIKADMDAYTRQLEAKKNALNVLQATDIDTAARKKVAELQVELEKARGKHVKTTQETRAAELELQVQIDTASHTLRQLLGKQQEHQQSLELMELQRKELHGEYALVAQQQWTGEDTCPTCQQLLPEDQIEHAKSEFNRRKSERLEAINQKGKAGCSQQMIEGLQLKIEEVKSIALKLREEIDKLEEQKNQLVPEEAVPFEHSQEYAKIMSEIQLYEKDASRLTESSAETAQGLKDHIQRLDLKLADLRAEAAQLTIAEQQRERIRELEDKEQQLASDFEAIDRGRYLCDEFLKAKVAMLDKRINTRFSTVRFRMFELQVNGALKEGCEVMVPNQQGRLVPFAFANNAARINAGLEIIDILGQHWGISIPVIVDNAESVTRLRRTKAQLIRLVVSEKDKKLRVELESSQAAAAS